MTIWSVDNHVRHPWFDPPEKKRKHITRDGDHSSSDESDTPYSHKTKRRRCSVLEHRLAHLSLHPGPDSTENDELRAANPMNPTTMLVAEECVMDADDDDFNGRNVPVLQPGYIEEPEQDVPEIQMKTSSWYELTPDRIVITDLDSFESEDELAGERGGLAINASLLEHLKKQPSLLPHDQPSQALVLFRPQPAGSNVGPLKGPITRTSPDNTLESDMEPMEVEV
ncbi:hypothetical protein AN958_04715 [Leucoagaricus sp. SymC.cos]|nr:hypothetical protein AN958_04715 [Leucoagaricus sp. SymC.cos]